MININNSGVSSNPTLLGVLRTANLNITTDQAITLKAGNKIITSIVFTNVSTTPTLATGGIYDTTSKGGNQIIANSQLYTGLTGATKISMPTLGGIVTTDLVSALIIYFSLTTANGSACTADIYIFGQILS